MPTYPQTLTNPGAESGTTGWTSIGLSYTSVTSQAHTGTHAFECDRHANGGGTSTTKLVQDVLVDPSLYSVIDHGQCNISLSAYLLAVPLGGNYSTSELICFYYSSEGYLLGSGTGVYSSPTIWTAQTLVNAIPAGTRTIRIGVQDRFDLSYLAGWYNNNYWDDFTLSIVDTGTPSYAAQANAEQAVVYGLVAQPADQTKVEQVAVLSVNAAQTSSGSYQMKTHQVVAYALVKAFGDKRKLRAWTFPQDDHKFWIVQLGNENGTLVYDLYTEQWCTWNSDGYAYWRGEDGCAWEGFNVCCDPLSGKIFQIDPEGRLDYNDLSTTNITPITSVVVGGFTKRLRTTVPCFMAELAISEGSPPSGIDPTTVGLTLRSGDTLNWYDHGSVPGTTAGDKVTVRWYGLGLMTYPGRIFEITDTGYARRIDGFNIDIGGNQNGDQ